MTAPVDVLAVMDKAMTDPCATDRGVGNPNGYVVIALPAFQEARAAVAELLEAAEKIEAAIAKAESLYAKSNRLDVAKIIGNAVLAQASGFRTALARCKGGAA